MNDEPTVQPQRGPTGPTYRPKTMEGYVAPSVTTASVPPVWKVQWDRITYLFDSTDSVMASIQATYPTATVSEEAASSTDTIKVYDVMQGRRIQDRVTAVQHNVNNVAVAFPTHGQSTEEF